MSGAASAVNKATAPPGGCKARAAAMTNMASVTAKLAVRSDGNPARKTNKAARADRVLPTTTAQGCAKGLLGTTKIRKALAPNGAISKGWRNKDGSVGPNAHKTTAQASNPNPAPIPARSASTSDGRGMDGPRARQRLIRLGQRQG